MVILLEVNYQLHCKYLRENKDTGSGNGPKLVNIHRVIKGPPSKTITTCRKRMKAEKVLA